jgi:hypothetical protein
MAQCLGPPRRGKTKIGRKFSGELVEGIFVTVELGLVVTKSAVMLEHTKKKEQKNKKQMSSLSP